ncbi:MAG: choline dehydrogenase-like flavoprotein [Arenicella sp.]|jgi:choline dehydrogenase-like flavoprotein
MGVPVLTSIQQTEKDKQTIAHAKTKLYQLASGLGSNLAFRPTNLSSHHLMGTTRMAASDEHGVVDSDLKVFGTKNLYIAGASVLPGGGAANPTLTLTALSMRLGEHLLTT